MVRLLDVKTSQASKCLGWRQGHVPPPPVRRYMGPPTPTASEKDCDYQGKHARPCCAFFRAVSRYMARKSQHLSRETPKHTLGREAPESVFGCFTRQVLCFSCHAAPYAPKEGATWLRALSSVIAVFLGVRRRGRARSAKMTFLDLLDVSYPPKVDKVRSTYGNEKPGDLP